MSTRLTRTLIKYVEHQGADTSLLLDGINCSPEILLSRNGWVEEKLFYELLERAEKLLNDKDVAHKVGFFSSQPEVLGVLSSIARMFSNPETLYEQGTRYAHYFNRCLRAKAKKVGEREFEYEITHVEPHEHYFQACMHTVGLLEAVPTLFGLPPATVRKETCWTKIDETGRVGNFYYGVDENGLVTAYPDKEKTKPVELKGSLAPDGSFVVDGVKFGAKSCRYHISFQKQKRRGFFTKIFKSFTQLESSEHIIELENANKELLQKHEELEWEALKLERFGRIASALVKKESLEDVLRLVSKSVIEITDAHIVNILLVGDDNSFCPAAGEWGLSFKSEITLAGIRQLFFEFGIDSSKMDVSKLPVVKRFYWDKTPVVVNKVSDILSPVFPIKLCEMLDNLDFTKNIALLPLAKEEELLGLLVITSGKTIDIDAVTPIANLAGQAIWNVKRTEELRKHEKELEQKVLERTQELEKAYRELKQSQITMIRQAKMASVGQLAAGVAHEINNPLGYFISDLGTLKGYVNELLQCYNGVSVFVKSAMKSSDPIIKELALKKKSEMEEKDIKYLIKDIIEISNELEIAGNKIKEIVHVLRLFARPGEGKITEFDINSSIESALTLLWFQFKKQITIFKELNVVSHLYGYPAEINQALLNIFVNAVEAGGDKTQIWIRSYEEDGMVRVEIEDNGPGIPHEIVGQIFDPFFTTKPIGAGKGVGLTAANEIVRLHGGLIEVNTFPGKGSKFTIVLPVKSPLKESGGENIVSISLAETILKGS